MKKSELASTGLKNVFSFQSYRRFIQSYIFYRKQTGMYSLTRLSKDLGFQSPNYISLIVGHKRNLTLADAFKVCRFFELSDSESKFFILLVQQNDCQEKREREFFKNWLDSMRAKSEKSTMQTRDYPELIKNWYVPALLACLDTTRGATLTQIIQLSGLNVNSVTRAFSQLLAKGLVRMEGERFFLELEVFTEAKFGTHYQFKEFQKIQLERSLQALRGSPLNSAKFASNFFLLKDSALQKLSAQVRELISSVDLEQSTEESSTLTQLNIQLFNFKGQDTRP